MAKHLFKGLSAASVANYDYANLRRLMAAAARARPGDHLSPQYERYGVGSSNVPKNEVHGRNLLVQAHTYTNAPQIPNNPAHPDLSQMIVSLEGSLIPRQYKTIPVRDSRQRPSRRLLSKSKWVKQGRWHDETQFSQGLRTSLLQMGNIKSITLYDFDWLWTISHSVVRTALVPGSLTSLILSGPAYRGGFRRTGGNYELAMILRQQPLLERLELWAGDWNMDEWILPTDTPHLRTLVSGVIEAIKLVPCRPVTSLNLIDIRQVPEDAAWQALATSASPILTLVLNIGLNHLKGILRGAAAYLIEVESLYLKGICAQDLGVIRKRFPMFHRLRTVHVPPGVCWHIITDPQRINFTEGIKLRCPSIEEVFLERVV